MESLVSVLVDGILVPVVTAVTAPLPALADSGILLLVFAALWAGVAVALVRDPARLDAAWTRIGALPLAVRLLVWLLFLPVMAGIWAWRRAWPRVARVAVVGGLAAWNLLAFLPRPA
ncbi:MAG TPA: hypothetical protein VFY23_00615 [Candidatus Limnocylindrales bacterium]|nr:hypothetical protein [Candidatus Limnocylindrales bacterium]